MLHVKRFFLWYTLVPLTVLLVAASYYRFMVAYDYEVKYEGPCDPQQSICYEYCETDTCEDAIHYTLIKRQAHELRSVCGDQDVLACEAAATCKPNEQGCTIEYCDNTQPEHSCESIGSKVNNL